MICLLQATLLVAALSSQMTMASVNPVYRATITPIAGTGSKVSGIAVVFTDGSNRTSYAGIVKRLMANLTSSSAMCNVTNGCGVHIHNGTSCANSTVQGGHYFASSVVTVDPWITARYSTDAMGKANFNGILNMGTDDVDGKPFIGKIRFAFRIFCS